MRKTQFATGEYYHIYNRGVDKRKIFTDRRDYTRFLAYLYFMNDAERTRLTDDFKLNLEAKPRERSWKPLVAIGAYCLMPNHFHLYLTPVAKDGISKFMQRVQTAYTMYFNKRHERSGALFQGTFKAQHIAGNNYAKYLFSYIHLNPAKLKDKRWKEKGVRELREFTEYLESYPYSSLREYVALNHQITAPDSFPKYLSNSRELGSHITDWFLEAKPRD